MIERSAFSGLRLFPLLALGAFISAASCNGCDGTSGNPNGGGAPSGGGGGWMVGSQGLMLNVDPSGRLGKYPRAARGDLLAISCWGPSRAWVAGDGGTLLTTEDAGATWRSVDVGTTGRLRAVEMVDGGRVFVVGDGGFFRVSADSGVVWQTVPAPVVSFTAIAPSHDGSGALLTTTSGQIYRYDGAGLALVGTGPGALESVALSADGRVAAAVGASGALLVSDDGGLQWRQRPAGTARGLHHVWLIGADGASLFAVGDGGVVVDGSTASNDVTSRSLGADYTLRGVHLLASGGGTIVGDRGALFVTTNFGTTWTKVETGETRDILSVDALGEDHEHW